MNEQDLSIIIVDDLQFSRVVVKTALKKAGYNGVRMANSANQALQMMDEKPADVVLADWMMPEMNGLELTALIRQRDEERGTYTAIILFTANDGIDYLVQAFDHGVDDYLCKPPNPQEMAARVNAAARVASLQNDLLETSRQMKNTIANLEKLALVDELTGAGNEQFLIRSLNAHLQEVSSRNGGVCLVLVTIRELETVRQHHGDEIVDEVEVSLYRRLGRTIRPTDIIARLDDNRFAIIIRHSNDMEFKTSSAQRILSMIDNRDFATGAGNITLHGVIGAYYYRNTDSLIDAEQMISRATGKLEQALHDTEHSIAF